jgi:hypothetical protein
MEDEFLMKVTGVCADPAPQQGEQQMRGLKMSWNTEGGRLVCRWVDSKKGEANNLACPRVPASRTLTGSRVRAASGNESVWATGILAVGTRPR